MDYFRECVVEMGEDDHQTMHGVRGVRLSDVLLIRGVGKWKLKTIRGMASAAVCCMGIQHTAAYSSIQQKMRVRMRVQEYSNTAAFPYSIQQKNCCMLLYGGHTAGDSIQQIPMISGVTNPYHGGYRSRSVAETCFRAHTSI